MNYKKIISYIIPLCFAAMILTVLISKNMTSEQVRNSYGMMAVVAFVGVIFFLVTREKTVSKEDYVSCLESKSGVIWRLPRKMNWHAETFPDSRTFLEKFGFTILGLEDYMLYAVEPPLGWTIEKWEKDKSGRYSLIKNETGQEQFKIFYKSEEHEYRAHITVDD